ncbi:MAG: hypothetical protein MHPSP_002095, partial [Paramarteilia canceri]
IGEILNQYENVSFVDEKFSYCVAFLVLKRHEWFKRVLLFHPLTVRYLCQAKINDKKIKMSFKPDNHDRNVIIKVTKQKFLISNPESLFSKTMLREM